MRQWVISVCVEILAQFWERVIRPDVFYCGHGYIHVTRGICRPKP